MGYLGEVHCEILLLHVFLSLPMLVFIQFRRCCSVFVQIIFLPMAFFIPPSQFAAHSQFNLLYQFWIHTEVVGNLGPLEWILNTPSHHRVHHGNEVSFG